MKQQPLTPQYQWTSTSYTPRTHTLTTKESQKRLNSFAKAIKEVSKGNLHQNKKKSKAVLYMSRLPQRLLNYRLKRTLSHHASQDDLKQSQILNHTAIQYEQIKSESDSEEHVNNLQAEPTRYFPRSSSTKMKPALKKDLSSSYLSDTNIQSSQKALHSSTISTATRTQLMRNASQGTQSRKMDIQISPYNSTLISPYEKKQIDQSYSKLPTRQTSNRGYVSAPFAFRPKTSPASNKNLRRQVELKQNRGIFTNNTKSRSPP